MNLNDIITRLAPPVPWAEGRSGSATKIPWDEPGFSARMLQEHLSQAHDAASRRFEIIDRQVEWIYTGLLAGKFTGDHPRLLDLGCGPGLYTQRLGQLGCECTGIDFSPASIDYAKKAAGALPQAPCVIRPEYRLADLRSAAFTSNEGQAGFDLVMLIYGEFNTFHPAEAQNIAARAFQALHPGGTLLLEVHTFDYVRNLGQGQKRWFSSTGDLFSPDPHIALIESFWDEPAAVAIERYFIINPADASVNQYASTTQAYTPAGYADLLTAAGFSGIETRPSLDPGSLDHATPGSESDFYVLLAQKE